MSPRLSVVTTVYNGEAYFDRAVPSILTQTYEDFEYIIVDDGSTDRTPEFLGDMAQRDPRITVLSPGRLGRTKSLNYAIDHARGDYVAIQDFDDRSQPERFDRQVRFLNAYPQVGVVGGYYVLVDDNRGERYVRKPPAEHEGIVRAMAIGIPLAHTVVAFRKEAWAQAGGYPEVDDIEDLRLWIAFARLNWKLANIPEILGEHWVHTDSFWHRAFKYRQRQRTLQRVQRQAVRELDLPFWMGIYPIGRYVYSFLPHSLRRIVRRSLVRSREKDISVW